MHVAVLPEGFTIPSLPVTLGLLVGLALVGALLVQIRPTVTDRLILGLTPWIALGGTLHGLHQLAVIPAVIEPFFGTAAVYATVTILAGATWLLALSVTESPALTVGVVGGGAFAMTLAYGIMTTSVTGGAMALVIGIGVGSSILTWIAWRCLRYHEQDTVRVGGWTGIVVVFGHALDGVSTAVGYDVLEVAERTPLARRILELGEALPTEPLLGAGWLFILVKIVLAGIIVRYFRNYVDEKPSEARLVLLVIAAVGLGPGVHNLFLFLVL